MEEKRMFLVSEEDLRSIMTELVHETIHEMIRTDRHGDMDDILTVTDISERALMHLAHIVVTEMFGFRCK